MKDVEEFYTDALMNTTFTYEFLEPYALKELTFSQALNEVYIRTACYGTCKYTVIEKELDENTNNRDE